MSYSDHEINQFGDVFLRLEASHRIRTQHAVSFELFMTAPADNERWILIYFANPALLAKRRDGANVSLRTFLENGPALVLLGAQIMDEQQRDAMGVAAEQLLHRQQIAANVFDEMNTYALQEADDARFERTHTVAHRGPRLIEAFHHYHPSTRRKTGGARV